MRNYEKHFEEDFSYIASSLEKNEEPKKYEKVIERIGRLKERYSSIAQYYEITVEKNWERCSYKINIRKEESRKRRKSISMEVIIYEAVNRY